MQLFLDCDGVLADFDKAAHKLFGMRPQAFEEAHGSREFWKRITTTPDFFYNLDKMHDADELVNATRHLNPIILTGRPQGKWGEEQKLRWRDKHFPDLEMIVCLSKDKIKHAKPGDVIVDDWEKHRQTWIDGGGVWVMHTSAKDSIQQLRNLGVI